MKVRGLRWLIRCVKATEIAIANEGASIANSIRDSYTLARMMKSLAVSKVMLIQK